MLFVNGDAMEIIPLLDSSGEIIQTDYLKARALVAEKGMQLPSHANLDDYLMNDISPSPIHYDYVDRRIRFPLWAREMIVLPEENGVFEK